MKKLLAALGMLTLTGCISQDYSDCPSDVADPDNVTLRFVLESVIDGTRAGELTSTVRSIDLVLFTDANDFVTHQRLEYDQLVTDPTVKLSISAGRYRVVCWGNITENSELYIPATFQEGYVSTKPGSPSGCPLYYAPAAQCHPGDITGFDYTNWEIEAPMRGTVVKDLLFTRAHRKINVYIQNFEDEENANIPVVEATNLAGQYDFHFNIHTSRRSYRQVATPGTTPLGTEVQVASFSTPFHEITADIHLNIQKQNGTVVTSVNLQDYIAQHLTRSTRAGETDHSDIDIYVRYGGAMNTDVVIEAVPWNPEDVDPVW
jgi:hypothetical protein